VSGKRNDLSVIVSILFHKRKRNVSTKRASQQRVRIKLKAFDSKIVDRSAVQIVETAEKTGAVVVGPVPLPTHIQKYTVNRATNIDKKSREQFEIRTHKRLLDIMDPTEKTITTLMHLSLPAGVGIEIKM